MQILTTKITKQDLAKQSENFLDENVIKGVVDVDKRLLAVDAPMHMDLEQLFLQAGSAQQNLWGINLYLDEDDPEELVEFDSMINLRPAQNNRTRGVGDEKTRELIKEIVQEWLI